MRQANMGGTKKGFARYGGCLFPSTQAALRDPLPKNIKGGNL